MAEETINTGGGSSYWEAIIPLIAGLISGQSATGKPAGMQSTTGPLTPEGQKIWDEYTRMSSGMPDSRNISMGGQKFTIPNYQKIGILKALMAVDNSRKNTLTPSPAETGWLGKLAPLLAQMTKDDGKGNNSLKNWFGGGGGYDANSGGVDPNYNQNTDWTSDIWRNSSEGE